MFSRPKPMDEPLAKTRRGFFNRIAGLFQQPKLSEETWEELEALLLQGDVGAATTIRLIETLRAQVKPGTLPAEAQLMLKSELYNILKRVQRPYLPDVNDRLLNVVFMVGVNGSGKTTSIAKLANYHKARGETVLLAAADTFRAAAIDQLKVWGERVDVEVIAQQPGADPGAVVYDAIAAARSRNTRVLIIDTAGRLQTKYNLMQELHKLVEVSRRRVHEAPHETLLVVDATTGQNGLSQAKAFADAVSVTGVVLAKLDSSAKGGIVFPIAEEFKLPVLFAATGEHLTDWSEFDPQAFIDGLFEH
ncbi:MAG: signal recognition particle-docking protein FtsY [Chloroflexi bacterium]|nr:signal recognition particle-docking protein FtsY [Chloroflexota bacterium]